MHLLSGDWEPTAAEEYHLASRLPKVGRYNLAAYRFHYEEHVGRLVAEGPVHRDGAKIALPRPDSTMAMGVATAIISRESSRQFASEPLSLTDLATLLYFSSGVRETWGLGDRRTYRRNVANSGGLGSTETYVLANSLAGVSPGIFHYDSLSHSLTALFSGRIRNWLSSEALLQSDLVSAPVLVVLTGAVGRLSEKYGLRGYRLALLDAGHVSAHLLLVATALGLSACPTAAFVDDELDAALRIDGLETATLLLIAVGGRHV